MTGQELVKDVFPDATDQQASDAIWHLTSFPFGSPKDGIDAEAWYRKMLEEYHEKSGGDINKAYEIADQEMDAAHKEFKERHPEDHKIVGH